MATAQNLRMTDDPKPQIVALEDIQAVPVKEDGHFDYLATSIQTLGILQPPILREPQKKEGKYEIIAGRRRCAVAYKLGINPIIAIVYPKSVDKAFIPSAAIAENQVRSKNIGSDIVAMGLLHEQGFESADDVSALTGLPLPEVKKLMELRDLPKPVLDGIVSGSIATTTAAEVKKLRPQAMERALTVLEETGKLTSNDIRKVREVQVKDAATQVVLPEIPDLSQFENDVITPKGDILAVMEGVIAILEGEGSDRERIVALRKLVGLPAIVLAEENRGATAGAAPKHGTIAQRERKRKTSTAPAILTTP